MKQMVVVEKVEVFIQGKKHLQDHMAGVGLMKFGEELA